VSVYLGHFSWRNSQQGSWFVQTLGSELAQSLSSADDVDFAEVLTKVARRVAYDFQSNAAGRHFTAKKQVPALYSTLTKEIHFPVWDVQSKQPPCQNGPHSIKSKWPSCTSGFNCLYQCCFQDLFKKLETMTKTLVSRSWDLGTEVSNMRPRLTPWPWHLWQYLHKMENHRQFETNNAVHFFLKEPTLKQLCDCSNCCPFSNIISTN